MAADLSDHPALERLKAEWQEQARNALLNDLSDKLDEMEMDCVAGPFDAGFTACWLEVRTWMVSQGRVLNGGNGTT